MGKISNVFTMLELLSNNKKYTIKELAQKLEVSERMVRSYKEDLEVAGIYIDTIRGPYGGYILNHNNVKSRGFSKYDLELLNNINDLLKDNQDFKFQKEYQNFIDKVKGKYKSSKKNVSVEALSDRANKSKYNAFSRAIKETRKVKIKFLSLNKNISERIIHPCEMFYYNDDFYVAAFCELRGEIRQFPLERVLEFKILDKKY